MDVVSSSIRFARFAE